MDKILIRGLTKVFSTRYGAVMAIENLALTVHEGEFFVLLGPSGCGKTTLIRIIAGVGTPDGGGGVCSSGCGRPPCR